MKKCLICFPVVLVLLASCAPANDPEAARDALQSLVEQSYALNEVYFGEGLPISDDREDVERFYRSFDTDIRSINYHPVAADAIFQSEDEIRSATEAVFSPSYCEYLFERAFAGISDTFGEGTENEIRKTAAYARYIQYGDTLTVRLNLADEAIPLDRTYSCADAEILENKKDYVTFSVPSSVAGLPDEEIRIKMVRTDDGWRLDSPTY